MSPSELSWLQGCLFLFLGVAGGYGLNRCQNRRTNHGTSDVELGSIIVDNGSTPPPSDDVDSSGADEQARSPSNLLNPVGEAMASTGAPRCPDRNRLRSKSRRRSRRLLQPSAKTRQKSYFLEFVAKTAAPNFATRETAYSTTVGDRISSPMSSPTAGLLPLSGGEDEALSPSHDVREVLALPGTPSCPDRKRRRSDSCTRMNAPDKRTKSPFENFMARNVGRPEPTNMVIADSSSTSMASKTAVLRRSPRRHFVPRPSLEVPLVDPVPARTSDGLRFRKIHTIELSASLCCDSCVRKVMWALKDVQGVEKVDCDQVNEKVFVNGSVKPEVVLKKVKKVKKDAKLVEKEE